MCQMQLLQNMLCPAAILVCSLCALVSAYLMMLLEIVQLLNQSTLFSLFHPLLCPAPWSHESHSFACYPVHTKLLSKFLYLFLKFVLAVCVAQHIEQQL